MGTGLASAEGMNRSTWSVAWLVVSGAALMACGSDGGASSGGGAAAQGGAGAEAGGSSAEGGTSSAGGSGQGGVGQGGDGQGGTSAVLTLDEDFEGYQLGMDGASEAVNAGPWQAVMAASDDVTNMTVQQRPAKVAVQISDAFAHSGSQSLMVDFGKTQEAITGLRYRVPVEVRGDYYLQWWELRSADYDWAGEKSIRIHSEVIGNDPNTGGYDYFIGWRSGTNQPFGGPGLDEGGDIDFVANSVAAEAHGNNQWSILSYPMPRQEWHRFEAHVRQGDVGVANGAFQLWIDLVERGGPIDVELRPISPSELEMLVMGGWMSGTGGTGKRYFDDVKISSTYIGATAD